jgi:hypothetical protein
VTAPPTTTYGSVLEERAAEGRRLAADLGDATFPAIEVHPAKPPVPSRGRRRPSPTAG